MKYIYVVFSATKLKMGRMIRLLTQNSYNHVSLSFDCTLDKMYSFARYNKHSALCGGLVEEDITRFYESEHKAAQIKVCAIPVDEETYAKAKNLMNEYMSQKEKYLYDLFGAVLMPVKVKLQVRDCYTCIGFVTKFLCSLGILTSKYNDGLVSVKQAEKILEKYTIYEGKMFHPKKEIDPNDEYFKSISHFTRIEGTISQLAQLVDRVKTK